MITQELRKRVAGIVKATLVEHFADKFVFDPIKVIPAVDEFGGWRRGAVPPHHDRVRWRPGGTRPPLDVRFDSAHSSEVD